MYRIYLNMCQTYGTLHVYMSDMYISIGSALYILYYT